MGVRAEVGSIAALDGLRGIAVLWVILFHYVAVRGPQDAWVAAASAVPVIDALVRNGYLGVDLFFLISGFLLTLPWFIRASQGTAPPPTREFYLRRVRRIVPAYYVHLLLLFLVFMPLIRGWSYWRWDFYVVVWNGVAHGLFLHTTSPLTSGTMGVNGALWTLAVEAQYYLLLPLLAPLFARTPIVATVLAFAAAVLWQLGARQGFDGLVALQLQMGAHWRWTEESVRHLLVTQMPSYLGHFALGSLLGRAWLGLRERGESRGVSLLVGLAGLGAFAALALLLASGKAPWGRFTWVITTLSLGALLFAAAAGRGVIARRFLGRGPLAFVGRVSYSSYLYHLPLLLIWHRAVEVGALSLPLYLALVVFVAWLSWRFVEQSFL